MTEEQLRTPTGRDQTFWRTLQLRALIDEAPKLQNSGNEPRNYGIQPSFLTWLLEAIPSGACTIETGTGLSTITFAILGTAHTAISPAPVEHNRIRAYCQAHEIPMNRLTFVNEPSQRGLPSLDPIAPFDLALIDGCHAFPLPILDYYYLNAHLAIGGMLAVDDLFIPSVTMLHRYLLTEPAYRLVRIDGEKTGIYRKLAEPVYAYDFCGQAMNARPDFSFLPWQAGVRGYLRQCAKRLPFLTALYRRLVPRQ